MRSCKAALYLASLLLASASLALAQGTYTQIDVPGSQSTSCFGIDNAGDIVGSYNPQGGGGEGFLLSNGTFTSIGTSLYGINDVGQVVGQANTSAFVYDIRSREFTYIEYPRSSQTDATAINNDGTVVGYFYVGKSIKGFELVGGTYNEIAFTGADQSYLYGINPVGEVVGFYVTKGRGSNFAFYQGKYWRILVPNAPYAVINGISGRGAVVGAYYPGSGVYSAGFVYQNKTLTTLQFPGSNNTWATAINNAGEVVGYFTDSSNVQHGFTWDPPADAEKK